MAGDTTDLTTPPRQRLDRLEQLERPHKIRKTHGDIHGDIHGLLHGDTHVDPRNNREDIHEAAAAVKDRNRIPSSEASEALSNHDREDQDHREEREGVLITSGTTTPPKRTRDMDQKISCELCKTRKVKCDRAEPACSWCARHNRQCVYLKRQTPGSRTRINAELESKVNRIDSLLRALGRRVEEHISQDHAADFERNGGASAGGAPGSSNGDGVSPSLGSPMAAGSSIFRGDDDVNSNSNATPNTTAGNASGPPNQTPVSLPPPMTSSSGMSMIWQSGNTDYDDDASIVAGGLHNHQYQNQRYAPPPTLRTPKPPTAELPPHDMLYTLVDLFFKHCNTWCPILDRKTIFGTFFGATSLEEPDRVLLHAIVATTLRFSKDARLTPEARDYYHTTSSQVVRLYAMDHITVPALRALVIVSLDEFGTSSGPRAWNLLAMVAQNVKQLGLCDEVSVYLAPSAVDLEQQQQQQQQQASNDSNVSSSSPGPRPIHQSKPDSWIEDEGRRRLCWVVYLLDRYATVCAATTTSLSGAGGAFLLEDAAMRRFLPCSYDLFSKNVPVETRSSSAWSDMGPEFATSTPHMPPPTPLSETASSMSNKAEHLGSFSYHCKLLRILSRIHDFLREPVDINSSADMARWRNTYQALDATLDGWLRGLPSEFSKISALCHSDPASRVANWFMLHSAYVTAVVRLHAPAAYPTARSTLFMPSQYAVQRCLAAVHSLADIARDLREANGLDLLGPPFAFSLWVAARVLLVHASVQEAPGHSGGGPQPLDGHSRIDFFIETLRHVGRHWAVANHYAATLARVAQRGRQGEITFSNMRRSAYDLLALTSTSRQSGAEPMSTQVTSLCELDNIDVFSFFVYPRMVEEDMAAPPSMAPSASSMGNTSNPGNIGMSGVLRTPMPPSMSMQPGSPHRGSSVF